MLIASRQQQQQKTDQLLIALFSPFNSLAWSRLAAAAVAAAAEATAAVAISKLISSKAVRYCSEKLSIIFSDILSWTDYQYRLSINWVPPIIFQYGDNLPRIIDIERHPLNINCNSDI
jgi:hypothetical protein